MPHSQPPVSGRAKITAWGLLQLRQLSEAATSHAGDAIEAFWQGVRSDLEKWLVDAGLDDSLGAIRSALEQGGRVGSQSAMFACRSLLIAVADYLWQAPGSEYPKPPGRERGALDVSPGKYMNRLGAYINERVESDGARLLLRAEAERIWESLDRLVDQASKGHDPQTTEEDAKFTVAATMLLLGELLRRTGGEPVESL